MQIHLEPIGTINSPFMNPKCAPRQAQIEGEDGSIVLKNEYCAGLEGLTDFSHIIAIYYLHKESEVKLKAKPCFDPYQEHGIFASRFTKRPNHIGISIFRLNSIENNILYCSDVDALNDTPLLDIKPYVKYFDQVNDPVCGWYDAIDWKEIAEQFYQNRISYTSEKIA